MGAPAQRGDVEAAISAPAVPALPPDANRPGWLDLLSVVAIVWYAVVVLLVGTAFLWWALYGFEEDILAGPKELVLDVMLAGVAMVACWEFACRRQGRSVASGLYVLPVASRTIIVSLATGIGCTALALFFAHFASSGPSNLRGYLMSPGENDPTGSAPFFLPVLLIIVPLSLCNELYYRGFLFPALSRLIGPIWATFPTVGFSMLPLALVMFDDRNFFDTICAGIIGVSNSWLRHRYRSVVPCLISRVMGDVAQVLWLLSAHWHGILI